MFAQPFAILPPLCLPVAACKFAIRHPAAGDGMSGHAQVEEPTVRMTFLVNTSPFAGREGKFVTSRNIKERLERELERNLVRTGAWGPRCHACGETFHWTFPVDICTSVDGHCG